MKKFIAITALIGALIGSAYAQKTEYTTKTYSENNSAEKPLKTTITINPQDSFIEVSGNDPQIFQITKSSPTTNENGSSTTQYVCSDNEAQDCTVKVIQSGSSIKIYFIYPDFQYYYTV